MAQAGQSGEGPSAAGWALKKEAGRLLAESSAFLVSSQQQPECPCHSVSLVVALIQVPVAAAEQGQTSLEKSRE